MNAYLTIHGILNLSVVTYYEVLNGLLYKDAHKQLQKFERFIDLNQVIFLNIEIAKKAAEIYANLRKTGQVIGHNDVLIAATAVVYDLTLIPNVGHLGDTRIEFGEQMVLSVKVSTP